MKKITTCAFLWAGLALASIGIFAQGTVTVTGSIKNSKTKEAIPAVSVLVKGTAEGAFTDDNGNFKLTTTKQPPFTIVFSPVGFGTKEITVNSSGEAVHAELDVAYALGQEIVVAASRLPERILESPVSIERISAANIRMSPAASYYDVAGNLKGVDLVTSSLTFRTISTRGFNLSGNERFNQIVDGMDNQAPGLNFSAGNIVGLTDLDVESMELLEGASSALYGPGGMNGTMLINSKSPFKYQGFSAQVREGVTNIDGRRRSASPYHDISFRWGQKVSDKFAFKIGAQFITAKEWVANDSSNYLLSSADPYGHIVPGNRKTDPNYNGINVYGDETNANMQDVSHAVLDYASYQFGAGALMQQGIPNPTSDQIFAFLAGNPDIVNGFLASDPNTSPFFNGLQAGLIPNQAVSRTGYKETEVASDNTKNFKISGGLYYKIKPDLELSFIANWGTGNSIYTGIDRYILKGFKMGQYKLELKQKNWFIKAYTTQEFAGDTYDATITTRFFNEAWKSSNDWFPQYIGAYVQAKSQGADDLTAQNLARGYADQGRPVPGTSQFQQLYDQVRKTPVSQGGGLIYDRTNLYITEGQYNLTDVLKIGKEGERTEVLIGADYRRYVLNSKGTIFADTAGRININESGAYLQVGQRLFNDVVKITASGRYDKQNNFKGRFTPRISSVINITKDHHIRLSYQTAYRFPTSQNQWINLLIGGGVRLMGGLPQLREFYHFNTTPTFFLDGTPATFAEYKPESSNSFEAGYKGLIQNKFLIDFYVYFAKYQNFLTRTEVVQPTTDNPPFSISVNNPTKVKTNGWGLSLEYLLEHNFFINVNAYSDDISNVAPGFHASFNAPRYRYNLGFGNSGLGKSRRLGFNIVYKWQDAFFYESDFASGNIPAYGVLDAQVSYKLPLQKLLFKLGSTNLTNHYYRNSFGNPFIGGLYYASIAYNVF